MRLHADQIAGFTGGEIVLPARECARQARGIAWDSRSVQPDDMYIALPGERVDGYDYCIDAIRAGASVLLIMRAMDERVRHAAEEASAAVVRVPDTFAAVTDLARNWRPMLTGTVLALTGSSGKTTTKNLVRDVLAAHGSVVATEGNQNNELGVPATLLRAQPEDDAVVVEMGMRGAGQIARLCSFVKPDMALVTNVGTSHIELLGSRDAIAHAKSEVLEAVPQGSGAVFVNASDEYARQLCAYGCVSERNVNAVFFDGSGVDPLAYDESLRPVVFASDVQLDDHGCPAFTLHVPGNTAFCHMRLRGLHNVHNACAAAAVGWYMHMDVASIACALSASESMAGRQDVLHTASGVTVVDDSYNANPDSMRASLAMFGSLSIPGRRFAILGDMAELGDYTVAGHRLVGEYAAHAALDRLICVGSSAASIASAAVDAGMPDDAVCLVDSAPDALAALVGELEEGDAVLVKASRSMGLERIVEGLVG